MCNWLFCLVGINTSSESSKIESCESFESTCPTTFRTQISNLNFFFWCRVFNEKKNIRVLFSDGCFFFLSSFCSSKWDYFSKWVGFWNKKIIPWESGIASAAGGSYQSSKFLAKVRFQKTQGGCVFSWRLPCFF